MIIADPDGRATLESLIDLGLLRRDSYYSFVRIREENNPAQNADLGYAAFDVAWGFDNTPDGSSNWYNFPNQIYRGFTFADADTIRMSWNAMAKAPPGYFRSEPIKGIASRPQGMPVIFEDLDSNEVEVLDQRYSGSVDIIEVPMN